MGIGRSIEVFRSDEWLTLVSHAGVGMKQWLSTVVNAPSGFSTDSAMFGPFMFKNMGGSDNALDWRVVWVGIGSSVLVTLALCAACV